jgi:hypothetical protein
MFCSEKSKSEAVEQKLWENIPAKEKENMMAFQTENGLVIGAYKRWKDWTRAAYACRIFM